MLELLILAGVLAAIGGFVYFATRNEIPEDEPEVTAEPVVTETPPVKTGTPEAQPQNFLVTELETTDEDEDDSVDAD